MSDNVKWESASINPDTGRDRHIGHYKGFVLVVEERLAPMGRLVRGTRVEWLVEVRGGGMVIAASTRQSCWEAMCEAKDLVDGFDVPEVKPDPRDAVVAAARALLDSNDDHDWLSLRAAVEALDRK